MPAACPVLLQIGYTLAPTSADLASRRADPVDTEQPTTEQPTTGRPTTGRQRSIKRRVVRLVLIPGVVALLLWFGASGYLVFQGFYNRAVANSVRQVSIPAVSALSSIQQERRLSITYLSRPSNGGLTAMLDRRRQTDQQLGALRAVADGALGNAPESIRTRWRTLTGHLDELPNTRSAIDARSVSGQRAYAFYKNRGWRDWKIEHGQRYMRKRA